MNTAEVWSLSSTPTVEIQSSDAGGATLFRVTQTLRLSSGHIAALNSGSNEVFIFAPDGQLRLRIGGDGDGPGEFRRASSMVSFSEDSLAVLDNRRGRLSVFGPFGDFVRDFALDATNEYGSFKRILPLGNHLAVFVLGGFGDRRETGTFWSEAESIVVDLDGNTLSSLGKHPGSELFIGDRIDGPVLFGATTYAATIEDEFFVGTADEPEIRTYSRFGKLTRILRWPDHDRVVSDERVEEYVEAVLADIPEQAQAAARATMSRVPRSARQPAFEQLLASPDSQELWVGGYRGPEMVLSGSRSPSRRWLVFGTQGNIRASLHTPPGFLPLAVTRNELLGVFVDDLGVESIRAYDVLRP